MGVLHNFFDESEEQLAAKRDAVKNASTEQRELVKLKIPGRYLAEVATFAFEDKVTKKMRKSPEFVIADRTKALMLTLNFNVVDGTDVVPAGASIFSNITVSPAKGASQSKFDNTINMMKPRIAALTGEEDVQWDEDWLEEWLVPTFIEEGPKKYKLVKDHKMKKKVIIVVEEQVYEGKPRCSVSAILKAKEGEKSVSDVPAKVEGSSPNVATPASNVAAPSAAEGEKPNISADSVDQSPGVDASGVGVVDDYDV